MRSSIAGCHTRSEGANRGVPVNLATGRGSATRSPGTAGTTNYTTATASAPGRHRQRTDRHRQSRVDATRRSASRAATSSKRCSRPAARCATTASWSTTSAASARRRADQRSVHQGVVQVAAARSVAGALTDVYFRGYDKSYPDLWRYNEWKREFDQFVVNGSLPEPLAGAFQPRPYGQLQHGARRREHTGDPAGRRRSRGGTPAYRAVAQQPLRRQTPSSSSPKTTARTAPTTSTPTARRPTWPGLT